MPQRKYFVATRILVFDFELFIGELIKSEKANNNSLKLPAFCMGWTFCLLLRLAIMLSFGCPLHFAARYKCGLPDCSQLVRIKFFEKLNVLD